MICINSDVIEYIPNSCEDCPLAFYDAHNDGGHFCGISRFDVGKNIKKKTRHKGCAIYDPNEEVITMEVIEHETESIQEDIEEDIV